MLPKYRVAAAALAAAAVLAGCSSRQAAKPVEKEVETVATIPGITAENYPNVNGSTSTIPLGQLILSHALGLPGELRRLPWSGDRSVCITFPVETGDKCDAFSECQRKTYHTGTHDAYVKLASDRTEPLVDNKFGYGSYYGSQPADLILVAREPSPDELALAKKKKMEFDVRPFSLDAFVFLVNAKNPVKSLTMDQIKSIYTGKRTKWTDLGWDDRPIQPLGRDRNSGSEELMRKLVMKDQKTIVTQDAMILTMSGVFDRVGQEENSVCYSVYYYEHFMMPSSKTRVVSVDGVLPASKTIADRSYPLTSEVYVVTRKGIDPESPPAKLRDWLLSDAGQKVVAESGYVPLRPVK